MFFLLRESIHKFITVLLCSTLSKAMQGREKVSTFGSLRTVGPVLLRKSTNSKRRAYYLRHGHLRTTKRRPFSGMTSTVKKAVSPSTKVNGVESVISFL